MPRRISLSVGALLAGVGLLLTACENTSFISSPTVAPADPAALRLAAAAEKAAKALDSIARVEAVRGPPAPEEDFSGAPPELLEPVTVTWTGPIEPITQMMALRAGYSFTTIGKAPSTPLVVTLDVFQKPLIKVLRDIGVQAGQRADLLVAPDRQQVQLRYAADDKPDIN